MSSYPERQRQRLADFDYSEPGMYFVTLCTEGRWLLFGTVKDAEMNLSPLGEAIRDTWSGLPDYVPGIRMDEFVIMPNHLHGIVCIGSPHDELEGNEQGEDDAVSLGMGTPRISLPQVMQRFKSFTTKQYLRNLPPRERELHRVLWQRGDHDRIIRNDRELDAIRAYIANNPLQWHLDHENPEFLATRGR